MHDFPKECLQELRMEFTDVEKEKRTIILSVTEKGRLTLGIE
jgi:acyl-coenzyme A thioesterase PaaI-like protein